MSKLQHFLREEDGAAAIEYGLLAGLIAVAIIGTSILVAGGLNNIFTAVANQLNAAAAAA